MSAFFQVLYTAVPPLVKYARETYKESEDEHIYEKQWEFAEYISVCMRWKEMETA